MIYATAQKKNMPGKIVTKLQQSMGKLESNLNPLLSPQNDRN